MTIFPQAAACFVVLAAGLAAPTEAAGQTRPKAVLELFTSQGCSSCPPADELAGELARGGELLVLTLAVDYWDYLGWKDTLGSAAHTARQRAYALSRGDRKVYTPQMIVNGLAHVVGSDAHGVAKAVEHTRGNTDVLSVAVALRDAGGQIEVAVEGRPGAPHAEVWLVALSPARTVIIGRGENSGKTVTYVNVVRRMTRLGAWKGAAAHFRMPREEALPADAETYVVVVQSGTAGMPGAILGVARGP